ncbi:hypothetical protein F5B22DRAFT_110183 [Xylaria bambusicola]|uniref:uncharacterized protein n=1 Tax=Xylaria bambusicola TaxID=326684 RepID=UPI002007A330|nr:uncharacterized protein F5B22DRAFT_110183 [Xylaria bambusicola]KAI0517574.1 hypothetical protein F5B22DRAFT_110183 [Xylaria bambusicola]
MFNPSGGHNGTLQSLSQSLSQSPLLGALRHEPRLHSPWKRSACDRCRSHKLKCQRKNNDRTQSCIRCTRAREVCFTSSAKSPAYPAQVQTHAILVSPVSTIADIADNGWFRRDSQSTVPLTRSKPNNVMDQDSAFLLRWPFAAHQEIYNTPPDLDFDVEIPSPIDEHQWINSPDPPIQGPIAGNEPFSPRIDHSTPRYRPWAPKLLGLNNERVSGDDTPILYTTPSCAIDINISAPGPNDGPNPGILLAELQRDLSKQLVAHENTSWDLMAMNITFSETMAGSSEGSLGHDRSFNPVASVLASISQFVTILHHLRNSLPNAIPTVRQESHQQYHDNNWIPLSWPTPTPSQSPYRDAFASTCVSPSSSTPAIKHRAQSRVHLLATINCYLLVLTVLDSIFSRLLSNSRDSITNTQGPNGLYVPSSPSPVPIQISRTQNAEMPDLVFAGHSAPLSARLRTQLLAQAVEYQLEILENELGLPQSYCVSSVRAESQGDRSLGDGILSKRESLLLLQALMDFAPDADDSGSFHHREEINRSPITVSLSDKLKRAKRAPANNCDL